MGPLGTLAGVAGITGVEFLRKPEKRTCWTATLCRDNSGNRLVLVEPSAYSAEYFN